jgi:hypothetical protein
MVIQDGTGQVLADTTPEKPLANTEDSVWSVTIDQTPAMQLQATYHVSTTVNQVGGVTLRGAALIRLSGLASLCVHSSAMSKALARPSLAETIEMLESALSGVEGP